MNNATYRNTSNTDNYQFCFNKLLNSKSIKIQNDVLTKETVKDNGLRLLSTLSGIVGTFFVIYKYMSSDTSVKTAGLVAAGASNIFERTNTLFNHGYGDDEVELQDKEHKYNRFKEPDSEVKFNQMRKDDPSQGWTPFTDEYMNKKTSTLNKKARDDINDLYKKNQKFRDEIVNFVGDKAGLSNEHIIDKKRLKCNTPNKLGVENISTFVQPRDKTRILIEILARYK